MHPTKQAEIRVILFSPSSLPLTSTTSASLPDSTSLMCLQSVHFSSSLPPASVCKLLSSLSCLDYCNRLQTGLPTFSLGSLKSVLYTVIFKKKPKRRLFSLLRKMLCVALIAKSHLHHLSTPDTMAFLLGTLVTSLGTTTASGSCSLLLGPAGAHISPIFLHVSLVSGVPKE